jgi:hypothetical protein
MVPEPTQFNEDGHARIIASIQTCEVTSSRPPFQPGGNMSIHWGRYTPALLTSYYSGDQKRAFELVQYWLENDLITYDQAAQFSKHIKRNELTKIHVARKKYGGLYSQLLQVRI